MLAKISEVFKVKKVKGEVGIEIEMEGDAIHYNCPGWRLHDDGSLRGNAVEYVSDGPVVREKVNKHLLDLQETLNKYGAVLNPSERCGVHVHVNCQDLTVQQTICFAMLYMIFEEPLTKFCGEQREGNFFCLRVKDSEYILECLKNAQLNANLNWFQDQQMRYAGINLTALQKFGSIEFRSMRTPKDFSVIGNWTEILLRLKDKSMEFSNPREMVEAMSGNGVSRFVNQILGQYSEIVQCRGINDMVVEGIRRLQDVAYIDLFKKKEELKPKKKKAIDNLYDELALPPVQQFLPPLANPGGFDVDVLGRVALGRGPVLNDMVVIDEAVPRGDINVAQRVRELLDDPNPPFPPNVQPQPLHRARLQLAREFMHETRDEYTAARDAGIAGEALRDLWERFVQASNALTDIERNE